MENRDFITIKKSKIEGHGAFAKRNIPKGARITEYKGERKPMIHLLSDSENSNELKRYAFGLSDEIFIDGSNADNQARFFNHSCNPNCETYTFGERVYMYAIRDIKRFEELTFDYNLTNPFKNENNSQADNYKCNCGSLNCRGTMIAEP